MSQTQSELRLARLIDEREQTHQLHEGKLEDARRRDAERGRREADHRCTGSG